MHMTNRNDEFPSPRVEGLTQLRDGLAALNRVPARALSGDQHAQDVDAVETTGSLDRAVTNEVDQLERADA